MSTTDLSMNTTIFNDQNNEYIEDYFNALLPKDHVAPESESWQTFTRGLFVLLLRAGYILIQIGSIPVENVYIILLNNLVDIAVTVCSFALLGYMLAFGKDTVKGYVGYNSWIGSSDFDYDNAIFGLSACLIGTAIISTMVSARTHTVGHIFVIFVYSGCLLPLAMHWIYHDRGWMHRNLTFTLEDIIRHISNIILPSPLWNTHYTQTFLSIVLLANDQTGVKVEKSLLLKTVEEQYIEVSVYLRGQIADMSNLNLNISSIDDISSLLNKIDELRICKYYDKSRLSCAILAENNSDMCECCSRHPRDLLRLFADSSFDRLQEANVQYICNKCHTVCPNLDAIHCHAYVFHDGILNYSINNLGLGFEQNQANEVNFTCEICQAKLRNLELLKEHEMLHVYGNARFKLQCTICRRSFGTMKLILKHYKKMHPGMKFIKCQICSKSFATGQQLRVHLRTHSLTAPQMICHVCKQTFYHWRHYQKHLSTHETERRYHCRMCDHSFTRKALYKQHLLIHQPSSSRTQTGGTPSEERCHICRKKLSNKIALIAHLQTHPNNTFRCPLCSISLKSYNALLTHGLVHKGPMKVCLKCKVSFPSAKKYWEHQCTGVPFKCDICGETFRKYHCLTIHKRQHSFVPYFRCDFCLKGFSTIGNLKAHENTHFSSNSSTT